MGIPVFFQALSTVAQFHLPVPIPPSFALKDFPIANLVNLPPPLHFQRTTSLSPWRSFLHRCRNLYARVVHSVCLACARCRRPLRCVVPSPPPSPQLLVLLCLPDAAASPASRQQRARSRQVSSTPRRALAPNTPPERRQGGPRSL